MRVRTIRKHINAHGPVAVKNVGRKYEVAARDARNLVAAGLVEEDKPAPAPEPAPDEDGDGERPEA